MLELRVHEGIRQIDERAWDALAGPDAPPFVRWAFFDVLESTGCATPDTGWAPAHLTLHEGERLVAAMPLYAKSHGQGEFVFDHAWADFASRIGVAYYPKLVACVPFTPATGPRALVAEGMSRERAVAAFAEGLARIAGEGGLSSAHVLFADEPECVAWQAAGLATRFGVQYQWSNGGYASFEDFLATLPSKRRTQIRRERREPAARGVSIETLPGRRVGPADVDAMYEFYVSTADKFVWGRRYLTRAFFEEIVARMPDAVEIVLAKDERGAPVAGAFNLVSRDVLYGRHWGARVDVPFLHFEVCYYRGIERAIDRGLSRFEPGAGGEHKRARGFDPTITRSSHWLGPAKLDRVVRAHLERERAHVEAFVDEARDERDGRRARAGSTPPVGAVGGAA